MGVTLFSNLGQPNSNIVGNLKFSLYLKYPFSRKGRTMLVHLPASGEIKGQSGPSDKEESSSPLVEAKPDNLTSKLDLEDSTSDKSSLDSSLDGLV